MDYREIITCSDARLCLRYSEGEWTKPTPAPILEWADKQTGETKKEEQRWP